MKISYYEKRIEAILFACGDSIEMIRLANALEIEEGIVLSAVLNLQRYYEEEERGIRIIRLNDSVQMVSNEEYHDSIQKVMQQRTKAGLSPSALEVLSVIAYNQPITKFAIEKLRGVDSAYVLSKLVACGLIQETGRLNTPGKPILYATTEEFLRCFSITSLNELPDIANF